MILGIDYGQRNIGLATSQGQIAHPWGTVKIKSLQEGIKKIEEIKDKLGIIKIVVGISEGRSRDRSLAFGRKISSMLELPVEFIDETLTTVEAENTGAKRKGTDAHAKAAAIILQRYLDESADQS